MSELSRLGIGRVAAPPQHESTSAQFYFWVDRNHSVERTQIVTTKSTMGGQEVTFIGVVLEVYRRSRQSDVANEAARFDGQTLLLPPFDSEGITYAEVAILRTEPRTHAPPMEESLVYLANRDEARSGYGIDRMGDGLKIGLIRNGGTQFAGEAEIDLDFLLGKNGGHLNVNGIAGLGTKSTLLLTINWLLLQEAHRQKLERPSAPERLQIVPVIFNVKNYDLFFIDRWNKEYCKKRAEHQNDWNEIGIEQPEPFKRPQLYAPQLKGETNPVKTGGRTTGVSAYSWSLSDVIELGLFRYLFADEDIGTANLGGLVSELEEKLTGGTPDNPKLRSDVGSPQTFQELLDWMKNHSKDEFADYASGTRASLRRRLKFIVKDGDGVLRRNENKGNPLSIPNYALDAPIVIDLFGIYRTPSLQRFVVAAVFQQIMQHQTSKQVPGLKFCITLDELNRFAPREQSDAITKQMETVASEGRSQGIILFGAQQQASLVKTRVIENAAIRAVGRSGMQELSTEVWRFLGPSSKSAASQLQPDEKLIYQPGFREPMLVKIPFPPFALSELDAEPDASSVAVARSTVTAMIDEP